VYAGKEVTAHERPVNFFGSQSSGYIVLDPYSGAGAYLIEGGENGSSTQASSGDVFSWLSTVAEEFIDLFGGAYSKAFVSIKGSIERMLSYLYILRSCDPLTASAAITSISLLVSGLGAIFALYAAILPVLIVLIFAVIKSIMIAVFIEAWTGVCKREDE
jgi:hypothetical protein